jgi:hypothetical protein
MLSQDLETIRAMMQTLPDGNMEGVRNTVREIIATNPGAREVLLNAPRTLEAIGLDVALVQ